MAVKGECDVLYAFRHPRAQGGAGRCVGRTDLPVDARRAKRMAHRIRALARRKGLLREVVTSPLVRSRAVGRWLARWGWRHRVDASLMELDFGDWDGEPWAAIAPEAIAAWCDGFADHAPGGGESVAALLARVQAFEAGPARIIVTHGGWLSARQWLHTRSGEPPNARHWPLAPRHSALTVWPLQPP